MFTSRHQDQRPGRALAGGQEGGGTGRVLAGASSLVLNQSLHLVHEVPGQLQHLLGVVPLGHF